MADTKHVITDTKELTALANKFNSFNLTADKKQSLLHSIAEEVKTQTEERFDLQRSPDGSKWQEISERTRAYYLKRGLTPQAGRRLKGSLLNRTGQLRDSITSKVDSNQALVGATKVYAAVHQFGYKKKKIPARPYLGINTENEKDIVSVVNKFIDNMKVKT